MSIVKSGTTGRSEYFNILDKTAGTPKTGLTITQLLIGYTRSRQGNVTTNLSALPNTSAAWSSAAAIEIDSANAPGLYRVDVPDAAYATGVDTVILTVYANTTVASVAPAMKEVQIDVSVATVTGNVGGSVGSVVGNVGGSVASVVGNVGGSVGSVVASVLANSVTGNVGGSVGSVVGNVGGAVSAVGTTVTAAVSTNNDKTGYSTTDWTTALTEAYRTNGSTGTPAQILYEVLAHLGESSISGTTKTIKKLDHATTAETFTLDSATTPSSITRAT